MSDLITVTLPDGSDRSLPAGSTSTDLAASIGSRLAKAAVIATVDGIERDLSYPLPHGAAVGIVTADNERGLYTIRHSTAHVLAQAVLDLYEGATFAIGPPVENGFYYDFQLPDGATFSAHYDVKQQTIRSKNILGRIAGTTHPDETMAELPA